jgi:hypothetical protein
MSDGPPPSSYRRLASPASNSRVDLRAKEPPIVFSLQIVTFRRSVHLCGVPSPTPVEKVAQRPEFLPILGATPYSLRRGGISLRLHAEDPQTVASECGTSLKMLSDHYAFAIEDLRRYGPRPVNVEWRAARLQQQALRPATGPERVRHRRKFFAFSARRRAPRLSWRIQLRGTMTRVATPTTRLTWFDGHEGNWSHAPRQRARIHTKAQARRGGGRVPELL